jgi:Flp pilus assembly protein TadG
MTEFALILPIFMVIVAGMLGFGRVFFYWIQANHVANETARWAIVDDNPYQNLCPNGPITGAVGCQSLQQHAANSSTSEFDSNTTVCIQREGATLNIGDPVTVTVRKPFTFVPILSIGKITVRASSTMRVENFKNGSTPSYSEACQS